MIRRPSIQDWELNIRMQYSEDAGLEPILKWLPRNHLTPKMLGVLGLMVVINDARRIVGINIFSMLFLILNRFRQYNLYLKYPMFWDEQAKNTQKKLKYIGYYENHAQQNQRKTALSKYETTPQKNKEQHHEYGDFKKYQKSRSIKELDSRINGILEKHRSGGETRLQKSAICQSQNQSKELSQKKYNHVQNQGRNYDHYCDLPNEKLGKSIQQFNEKIKRSEQMKKKLKIQFKPFENQTVLKEVNRNVEKKVTQQKASIKQKKLIRKQRIIEPKIIKQQQKATTNEIKRLINCFIEQVTLDEQYRNAKVGFECLKDQGKFTKLQEKFDQKLIFLTLDQCKQKFSTNIDQHNPFFKFSEMQLIKNPIENLVSSFMNTRTYWETFIFKKFKKENLFSEGLKSEKLDFEKKGFISAQDLARFINIESGNFYRKRDVLLIFKRFCSDEKTNFKEFLDAIAI